MRLRRYQGSLLISVGPRLAVLRANDVQKASRHAFRLFSGSVKCCLNIELYSMQIAAEPIPPDALRKQEESSYVPTYDILDMCMLSGNKIVVCDDMKRILLFESADGDKNENSGWIYKTSLLLAKRCNILLPIPGDMQNSFLAGDKSGDVWKYSPRTLADLSESEIVPRTTHECVPNGRAMPDDLGTFVLSVNCTLLDMVFCGHPHGSQLAVSDRDEKTRLCSFPDSYNIEHISMKHTAFVTALAYAPELNALFSTGGDGSCVAVDLSDGADCRRIGYIESRDSIKQTKQIRLEDGTVVGPNILGVTASDDGSLLALFHQQSCEVDIYAVQQHQALRENNRAIDIQLASTIAVPGDVADICFYSNNDAELYLLCLVSSVRSTSALVQPADSESYAETTNLADKLPTAYSFLEVFRIDASANAENTIPSYKFTKISLNDVLPAEVAEFLTKDPQWLAKPHKKSNLYGARHIYENFGNGDGKRIFKSNVSALSRVLQDKKFHDAHSTDSEHSSRYNKPADHRPNHGVKLKTVETGGVKRKRGLAD